jgi:hypothetical protein
VSPVYLVFLEDPGSLVFLEDPEFLVEQTVPIQQY